MAMIRLLTVEQAAGILNFSLCTIYRMCESGDLPHVRLGRTIRFVEPNLLAWIEARSRPGSAAPVAAEL